MRHAQTYLETASDGRMRSVEPSQLLRVPALGSNLPEDQQPWKPASHWEDHPQHTAQGWRAEAYADDTRLGYVKWVNAWLEEQLGITSK